MMSHSKQQCSPKSSVIVGRFAPTPSGRMHLGNVFSALISWLAVRAEGGCVVLRIEDLDLRARNRAAAQTLIEDLSWLGLDWDEGPVWQSEREALYQKALDFLSAAGLTYPCFCTRAELHAASAPHASDGTYVYQGTCRNLTATQIAQRAAAHQPAIRLMVPADDDPAGHIRIDDLIFGRYEEILARDCGDFLVRRSDGVFAYQLAVVVDDGAAGVNLVVRGRDLLGSAARQTYLARLLGITPPRYAHIPMLIAPDGRRLSKRDRDLDLGTLRSAGIAPERIVGALAAAAGLISSDMNVRPADLVEYFSWDTLRAHRKDIVTDKNFIASLR